MSSNEDNKTDSNVDRFRNYITGLRPKEPKDVCRFKNPVVTRKAMIEYSQTKVSYPSYFSGKKEKNTLIIVMKHE